MLKKENHINNLSLKKKTKLKTKKQKKKEKKLFSYLLFPILSQFLLIYFLLIV